jgi:hypothetical protein
MLLPDTTTIRYPDDVFQSESLSTPICLKRSVAKCGRTQTTSLIIKKGIMDTQQNPNEPGKSPGQQGGQQQDREREERERKQREREKQGGGQGGGGQQGGQGGQQGGR